MKVLVVDDTALDRQILSGLLRAAGHEAVPAISGEAAVLAVRATAFDLVFMDMRMPGIDGIEAARRIRALDGERGQVPIIAVSGRAKPPPQLDHDIAFMDKASFNPDTLAGVLANHLPPAKPPEDAGMLDESPMKTEESSDFRVRVPRSVFWGAIVLVPGMIVGGTWYMATQAATIDNAAKAATETKTTIIAHQTAADLLIQKNSDALIKLEHDQSTLLADMVGRLIKIESKIDYYAPPPPPRR